MPKINGPYVLKTNSYAKISQADIIKMHILIYIIINRKQVKLCCFMLRKKIQDTILENISMLHVRELRIYHEYCKIASTEPSVYFCFNSQAKTLVKNKLLCAMNVHGIVLFYLLLLRTDTSSAMISRANFRLAASGTKLSNFPNVSI